ncbi:uncharacterized protein LOC142326384 [Lycorma delicatula]|uniref:uncharacterized protein LOC142326384 n=1 Tax=Lycorma delicatula TaxID=130591 RepID=UPI003F51368A
MYVVPEAKQKKREARLNPVNEDIYPVYIRQKVIRKYEKIEYPAPVTEENNTGMWYIRFKRFCKFVEACRIVLIQCRMLRRLEILKKLTPEKILELENDEE